MTVKQWIVKDYESPGQPTYGPFASEEAALVFDNILGGELSVYPLIHPNDVVRYANTAVPREGRES